MVDEHFLICPIEHVQSSLVATDLIREEIMSYQKRVRSFYKRKRHYPVFFERNYKTSHMQVQCVPVPIKFEESFVKDIFLVVFCLHFLLSVKKQLRFLGDVHRMGFSLKNFERRRHT